MDEWYALSACIEDGKWEALSVRQPWAHLILHQGKDIENRTWRTDHRGPLLIHASKTWASRVPGSRRQGHTVGGIRLGNRWIWAPPNLPRGALVGLVIVLDCIRDSDSPWAEEGMWHWVLGCSPIAFPRPIPYRGRQGLFEVPDEVLYEQAASGDL